MQLKSPFALSALICSLVGIGFLFYLVYIFFKAVRHKKIRFGKLRLKKIRFGPIHVLPHASCKMPLLKAADFICIAVIMSVYSCFALYDLGDMKAPSTPHVMECMDVVTLDFGDRTPDFLSYYMGNSINMVFSVDVRENAADEWVHMDDITFGKDFVWETVPAGVNADDETVTLSNMSDFIPDDMKIHQMRFTMISMNGPASIFELTFTDRDGNVITPVNAGDYPTLFDESHLWCKSWTFRNGMYFDEPCHARTAYEFLKGYPSYSNDHPPLGKILISIGIAIFGMNPFGWRIVGTVFGIAMIPFVYLFAKRILKNTWISALACILFSFDFMHFTQTRVATLDVYITFFVILMYYFMHQYSCMSFYDTPLKKTLIPLGICGVCMGLGIACKWTGVFAGFGLAMIFFSVIFRRYMEYLYAKRNPNIWTNGISHNNIVQAFFPNLIRTIGFCVIFFIIIPIVIYTLSYIPMQDGSGDGLIMKMLNNQKFIFNFHSTLTEGHMQSSVWYKWPSIEKPFLYYYVINTDAAGNSILESISAFGNPAVWWAGIPAFFYNIYLCIRRKDKTAAFLITGYLAQWLPWMFISRCSFIYHYFPNVVFVVLMITHGMMRWSEKISRRKFYGITVIYGIVAVCLFLLFYPVLSGYPVSMDFVRQHLQWFTTWQFGLR